MNLNENDINKEKEPQYPKKNKNKTAIIIIASIAVTIGLIIIVMVVINLVKIIIENKIVFILILGIILTLHSVLKMINLVSGYDTAHASIEAIKLTIGVVVIAFSVTSMIPKNITNKIKTKSIPNNQLTYENLPPLSEKDILEIIFGTDDD